MRPFVGVISNPPGEMGQARERVTRLRRGCFGKKSVEAGRARGRKKLVSRCIGLDHNREVIGLIQLKHTTTRTGNHAKYARDRLTRCNFPPKRSSGSEINQRKVRFLVGGDKER
ncbi:hypothetical protein J6590_030779 [Homalodisca vitripennis]|nr:hypothetical protein J6590_030779 [Homalodisca vitripennis]